MRPVTALDIGKLVTAESPNSYYPGRSKYGPFKGKLEAMRYDDRGRQKALIKPISGTGARTYRRRWMLAENVTIEVGLTSPNQNEAK